MKRFALAVSMMVLLVGCKPATTAPPALAPGAVNATDQLLYQSLKAAQATIDSLKTVVVTNPSIRAPLNQAILDYNVAEVAYQAYHAAAVANAAASPVAAQSAVNKVQTDLSAVPSTGGVQ